MDFKDLERIGAQLMTEANEQAISIASFRSIAFEALQMYTRSMPLDIRNSVLSYLDACMLAMAHVSNVSIDDLHQADKSLHRASQTTTELAKLDEIEHAVNGYDPCI